MNKSSSMLPRVREGTLITHVPPSPAQETPQGAEEIMKCIAQAEWLGRLPQSLLTQQLAQMAAEAGPSMLGGEEPAMKKLQPTVGGKTPQKKFLKAGKVKKTWKYQWETVALQEICWFQKEHQVPHSETPLLAVSP